MELILERPQIMCERLVIVDGLPGCGKTMLASIINSLKDVEQYKYSYEIEKFCLLNFLNKIDSQAAGIMIKIQLDLMLYNTMMSREVNFRYNDLSSVLKSKKRWTYIKRLFSKGDEVIPQKILKSNPILHVVTHCLSAYSKPLLSGFSQNKLLINMYRHPLYMIKQNMWNMKNLIGNKRHFDIYFKWKKKTIPYFFLGQEEKMLKASPKEKAIFFLEWTRKNFIKNDLNIQNKNYYELTFESFLSKPNIHLFKIQSILNTTASKETPNSLIKEKIPRNILSDGRDLDIYRRVGWEKTEAKNNMQELDDLYFWCYKDISSEAKQALDWLLIDYENIVKRLSI